jgi:hypothetical protein
MVELARTTQRRKKTVRGVVALTLLGLGASSLPAGGVVASAAGAPAAAASGTPAGGAQSSGGTVVDGIDVPSVGGGSTLARNGGGTLAALPRTSTDEFAMVGVTWPVGQSATGVEVLVSTRSGGVWSGFEELHLADDPGEAAGDVTRSGTEPLWVGEADGVAVRIVSSTATRLGDVEVTTVMPDRTGPTAAAQTASVTPAGAGSFPTMPDVITRREWGADPDLGDTCWEPRFGRTARAVVVHHTVNSNDYSREDAPAIVRSIHAYHTQGQGWCDIGYNFLVDRFGQVYQGRAGGMRKPVRGSHAGDYNTDTVGISMIGDFDVARVPGRLRSAMVRLIGWRLGTSYTRILGRTRIHDLRVPHILAHRDVMSTACPGRFGIRFLPPLRRRVRAYLADYDPPIQARAHEIGRDITGPVYVGEVRVRGGFLTRFEEGRMLMQRGAEPHWIAGEPLEEFLGQGGIRGPLGFPTSDLEPTSMPLLRRMRFEHGVLYRYRFERPSILYGRIRLRWGKLGGPEGALGLPLSSVRSNDERESARFENGRIVLVRDTNELVVEIA